MNIFYDLCEKGDLNELKTYYEENENVNIYIHANNDYAFRESCSEGRIDVAKWLYSLSDVNDDAYDIAFKWCCRCDQLEVAKWLYSLNYINVHAEDDCAFRWSYYYGKIEVAIWLTEICSDYELIIENNQIKSYKIITIKDKIKDKSQDEIIKILNIKTSDEQISEQCIICLDDANLKLHDNHNHFMCFDCMIEWYINNDNQLKCQLCKTYINYQNMILFIDNYYELL